MDIKTLLLNHETELKDYFERAKVNANKTDIKYSITHLNMSMVFYIKGEIDESVTDFKAKIAALFNTNTDISELDEYARTLKSKYEFVTESPFLRITNEPALHAFQVTLRLVKG